MTPHNDYMVVDLGVEFNEGYMTSCEVLDEPPTDGSATDPGGWLERIINRWAGKGFRLKCILKDRFLIFEEIASCTDEHAE